MTKFYLAARYTRNEEMRNRAADLVAMGHVVTSRWIAGDHQADEDLRTAKSLRIAREDWADIVACDCLISFTEKPRLSATRGGRHWETGAAFALGKRILIVGPVEHVFHLLGEHYLTWPDCLRAIKRKPLAAPRRRIEQQSSAIPLR